MAKTFQQYKIATQVLTTNTQVDTNCADFTVFNAGNGQIFIDNLPLDPGQSFSVTGNVNEIYTDIVTITFESTATIKEARFVKRIYQAEIQL